MRILMCPPKYFDVPLEDKKINPWMQKTRRPNRRLALEQWGQLADFYRSFGIKVITLAPKPDLFDQVFTANLAWGKDGAFVMANFRPAWRDRESLIAAEWFVRQRFSAVFLPKVWGFEGQGDIVDIGNGTYLFCYGIRNDIESKDFLESFFQLPGRFIPLRLVSSKFYHGDVCIRYSRMRNAVLFNPSAFDSESLHRIEKLSVKLMEAPRNLWVQETEKGRNFPLNGCYLGLRSVETFPWDGRLGKFPAKVRDWIEKGGGSVWLNNFDQFGLSGAGHRCCTFFVD